VQSTHTLLKKKDKLQHYHSIASHGFSLAAPTCSDQKTSKNIYKAELIVHKDKKEKKKRHFLCLS